MTSDTLRIGFCTDLSGAYESVDGHGGAEAIRMAIADLGSPVAGCDVELMAGDHRNDVAEAARLATRWLDEDAVDMIVSGVNSDTSLAITAIAAERGRPAFVVGAGTSVQARERAAPTIVQYAYDTVALATVPATVLTRQGGNRWYFVTADYPFGRELEEHGRAAITAAGGHVVGSVRNRHDADDFTRFVAAALASGAHVLGLANGHAELVKAMAAVRALGAMERMTVVGLLTFIDDLHAIGLDAAQGLVLADSWYWSRDDDSRAWAERFKHARGRMPSSLHAADYSAVTQYCRAVAAAGTRDAAAVMAALRGGTLSDMYVRGGRIRDDGTHLHDIHLLKARTPGSSTGEWDVYEPLATLAGEQAFARA